MNKKNRYILIWIPFVVGSFLFCFGTFNLFSSLLFFVGGYVGLKNTFDIRRVKKINNQSQSLVKKKYEKDYSYRNRSAEDIVGFKRARRYTKVRKRVKY